MFVCAKDGLPVTTHRHAWRHALGGKTGAIPRHRRHRPVPVLRTEYERAFGISTPAEEARALLAKFRRIEAEMGQG
jgi:hypothetical protein